MLVNERNVHCTNHIVEITLQHVYYSLQKKFV